MKKLFILFLLICSPAFAEEVATYSGQIYTGCSSMGDTKVFLDNPNDYATQKIGYIYLPNGCKSLPQVAAKYLYQDQGQIKERTQAEKDAIDQAESDAMTAAILSASRTGAKDSVDQLSPEGVRLRAAMLVTLDEVNNLRTWLRDFKAATAAATSLANLQTRVAALPNTPDRTATQLRTAIKNLIDAGTADA